MIEKAIIAFGRRRKASSFFWIGQRMPRLRLPRAPETATALGCGTGSFPTKTIDLAPYIFIYKHDLKYEDSQSALRLNSCSFSTNGNWATNIALHICVKVWKYRWNSCLFSVNRNWATNIFIYVVCIFVYIKI